MGLKKPSAFRRMWMKVAAHMRERDGNWHTYEISSEEKEHLSGLWSRNSVRPDRDLEMMDSAGYSRVEIINKVDRRFYKGKRYIEYGYHPIHFMIIGTK